MPLKVWEKKWEKNNGECRGKEGNDELARLAPASHAEQRKQERKVGEEEDGQRGQHRLIALAMDKGNEKWNMDDKVDRRGQHRLAASINPEETKGRRWRG